MLLTEVGLQEIPDKAPFTLTCLVSHDISYELDYLVSSHTVTAAYVSEYGNDSPTVFTLAMIGRKMKVGEMVRRYGTWYSTRSDKRGDVWQQDTFTLRPDYRLKPFLIIWKRSLPSTQLCEAMLSAFIDEL